MVTVTENIPRVAILLPTFNGERYLPEQLDSLTGQTYENTVIVVRDDGSSDRTAEITQIYQSKFPQKFLILENDGRNLGASGSFSFLICYVLEHKNELGLDQAYMMFCDQDDIWAAQKIEIQMERMNRVEESFSADVPILVHSDLKVISDSRELVASSFIQYQGLKIDRSKFSQILLCNVATGCSVLINERLARKSIPVSSAAIMHDWWIALVAAAFGKLVFVSQPLLDYRQHSSNTIGAKEYKKRELKLASLLIEISQKREPPLICLAEQAKAFLKQYGEQLGFSHKLKLFILSRMKIRSNILQKLVIWILYRLYN